MKILCPELFDPEYVELKPGDTVEALRELRKVPKGEQGRVHSVYTEPQHYDGRTYTKILKVAVHWESGVKMSLIWWQDCIKFVSRP